MTAKVKLGYWNVRAFAQPIRLLLAYTGTDFEEKRYNFVGTQWDRSEWLNEKFIHGLDFPNLPYLIDGNVKLTQTFAILKYLGRKHGLVPKNEEEHRRIDLIEAEAMDIRTNWVTLCYGSSSRVDFGIKKPEYLKNLSSKLKAISGFLGSYNYFAGDHVTYVDFLLYEIFDVHSLLEPSILDDFPNLKAFHARIKSLPSIASYIKSSKFIAWPLNAPWAYFGGDQ